LLDLTVKPAVWCLAALVLAEQLQGFIHIWGIGEIEDCPALVVGTVLGVERKEPLPGPTRSKPPEQYWEVTLRVHRAYSRHSLNQDATVRVRYVANLLGGMQIQGAPIWPHFEKGETALFPLAPAGSGNWRLVAEEGSNLTVPALLSAPQNSPLPRSGRAFILSELANTLANGSPIRQYAAAEYLREPGALPDGFREVLEREVGTNDDRWLEVACALLASRGIPHPSIQELMADPNMPGTGNQLAAWALQKGAKRNYPNRLISCLLRNMSTYEWGAANSLLDFKDSPLAIHELTGLLTRDPGASIHVASVLVRNGQRAFLREALDAAQRLVSDPGPVAMNRLQASSGLLRDYGSDEQFNVILATLRRLKAPNEDAYRKLFGSVSGTQSKRELRVALILIDDRRPGFGSMRYCDVAAATVERLSGEHFGFNQEMTSAERDRVVVLANAWLSTHRNIF
jgi:hypothetical protein